MKQAAVIVIKNDRGEYLMQKRTIDAPNHPGLWTLFGGGVKENEIPLHAIQREVKEELNIEISDEFDLEFLFEDVWDNTEVHLFKIKLNDISKISLREGCGFAFLTYDELKKYNVYDKNTEIINKLEKEK